MKLKSNKTFQTMHAVVTVAAVLATLTACYSSIVEPNRLLSEPSVSSMKSAKKPAMNAEPAAPEPHIVIMNEYVQFIAQDIIY